MFVSRTFGFSPLCAQSSVQSLHGSAQRGADRQLEELVMRPALRSEISHLTVRDAMGVSANLFYIRRLFLRNAVSLERSPADGGLKGAWPGEDALLEVP